MRQLQQFDDTSLLRNLAKDDPETYEQYILIALYKSAEFRKQAIDTMCWSAANNKAINIFEYPVHYALFKVIKSWRVAAPSAEISDPVLLTYLTSINNLPKPPIEEDDIPVAVGLFREIMAAVDVENALAVVEDTWRDWAKDRSLHISLTDMVRSGQLSPDEVAASISGRMRELSASPADRSTSAEFGDGMAKQEDFVERLALSQPMSRLNKCLGGGFGKTEHVMFVAPTGGGKTVLACQLAADLASSGYQVLFISTEQDSEQLEPRIISCLSDGSSAPILFETIKDGVKREKLSSSQWDVVNRISKSLRGNLHFENWMATGKSVSENISAAVDEWNAKLKVVGTQLDCVILDWIGGAIVEGSADQSVKRMRLQEAATEMKNLAYRANVAAISFAQAVTGATKKARLDASDIADNKTMHHEAVALFCISAKAASDDAETESSTVYNPKQIMNCVKTRKGEAGVIHITRRFQYQRFTFSL